MEISMVGLLENIKWILIKTHRNAEKNSKKWSYNFNDIHIEVMLLNKTIYVL